MLAIVKEYAALEGMAGRDGVTIYSDASLGRMAKEQVSIRLPERAFVHNLVKIASMYYKIRTA